MLFTSNLLVNNYLWDEYDKKKLFDNFKNTHTYMYLYSR